MTNIDAQTPGNCGDCIYFDITHSECRRHSPNRTGGSHQIFPYVSTFDWCGDFVKQDDK